MKKAIGLVLVGTAVVAMSMTAMAGERTYKIGFTQSYNGNSYRQTEERLMEEAVEDLKAQGYDIEYTVSEANQDANAQIQHIQDFVLQGYDLIIVDPASASSLNDAIQEACDAGIPVFDINDGPITMDHENLYHFVFNNVDMMYTLTKTVCEEMGGSGKLIELRGTAGVAVENEFHEGVLKALEEYPDVEVVAEIYTDWTASKAQTELNNTLPVMDQVDGLVTQGGDAYAAVQAFLSAGYDKLPVIGGDNRGSFINWWGHEAPEGYKTLSVASNPWIGAMSLYVAIDLLNGEEVKNDIEVPFGAVDAEHLADYVDVFGDDDVAYTAYTWDEVREYCK